MFSFFDINRVFVGVKRFMSMTVCDRSCVFTICFYDYDILSLIEMVLGAVLFKETDHLIDTIQRSIEVGSCLSSVTCGFKFTCKRLKN